MDTQSVTLAHFIMDQERGHAGATGEFSALLSHLTLAGKVISREVSKAGLVDILGYTGQKNVQGEQVQKLDIYANTQLVRMFETTGLLCGMGSEEEERIIPIPEQYPLGKYVIAFDPLDGSSNIDANVNIGTIFSIHRQVSEPGPAREADFLQKGTEQVCAGYILYGTATMLVYTTGNGVHGFTLDPSVGEFLLSHEDIKIPARGRNCAPPPRATRCIAFCTPPGALQQDHNRPTSVHGSFPPRLQSRLTPHQGSISPIFLDRRPETSSDRKNLSGIREECPPRAGTTRIFATICFGFPYRLPGWRPMPSPCQ